MAEAIFFIGLFVFTGIVMVMDDSVGVRSDKKKD